MKTSKEILDSCQRRRVWLALATFLALALLATSLAAAVVTTTRVSVASDGTQGNDYSEDCAISADGRFVAFYSYASNLAPGDTNQTRDIFVHDRQTAQTTRVSVASDGSEANGPSRYPSISADGRFVAFDSSASNLVPGDTNGYLDAFVHDRQTGQTTRVSVASDGTQGNRGSGSPAVSADGRFVAFMSWADNLVPDDTSWLSDTFVYDQQTGQTTRVSVASDGTEGNGISYAPAISADGRFVAFLSYASNLVPGDTNEVWDTFVHDRQTGQTNRVSIASDGTQGDDTIHSGTSPAMSADGRFVAFTSRASTLVPGDTNGYLDVFVHDSQTGQTTRASVASNGSEGDRPSGWPTISADGRFVAFYSDASNLVYGDTNRVRDIFVHDRQTGSTSVVSINSSGWQGNASSDKPSISADGQFVAFASLAANLVSGDTNNEQDVFVVDALEAAKAPRVKERWTRIAGFVCHDQNGDGLCSPEEQGIEGVDVQLQPVTAGSSAQTNELLTYVTNTSGWYSFNALAPGTYTLSQTQPQGWTSTTDDLIEIVLADEWQQVRYDFGEWWGLGGPPDEPPLEAQIVSCTPVADGDISQWTPERKSGQARQMVVRQLGITSALLRFDLADCPLPEGATLVTARLKLFATARSNTNRLYLAGYPLRRPWVEKEVTWLQAAEGRPWTTPGTSEPADRGEWIAWGSTDSLGWMEIPLTAQVQAWLADPPSNHGLLLQGEGTRHRKVEYHFATRENGQVKARPSLELHYVLPE
jgi:Tol biopolymer transport system component